MIQHPSLWVNILIVVGESFWVFSISAQLVRLYRTRNTKGLAPVSQTLNTTGNVGWATYFGINHLWFPFVTNTIMFFLSSTTLGFTLSNRKKFARGLIAIAVIGPITAYVLISNPDAGGWIGMLYNWVAGTPQLIKIVRHRKVSGLSPHGIYFAFAAMLCVLTYGFIIHSLPLVIGCVQGIIYETVVLRFFRLHRHSD